MKLEADREVCIGAGNCVMTASEVFDQDDDGTVVLLESRPSGEALAQVRRAVELCPSGALRLSET